MAVVAVDGGDGRARAREGESREGRRGSGESEGGRGGVRGVAEEVQGDEGAAGGGSRRWCSGAGAPTRLCLLAEVEDSGELGWAGRGRWAR